MNTVEEYIVIAEKYHKIGIELFSKGDYYDASEKIWACIKIATMDLTQKYLGRTTPPKDVYWRDFVREAFLKAGLTEKRAKEMANYFIEVRSRLHGEYFYGQI